MDSKSKTPKTKTKSFYFAIILALAFMIDLGIFFFAGNSKVGFFTEIGTKKLLFLLFENILILLLIFKSGKWVEKCKQGKLKNTSSLKIYTTGLKILNTITCLATPAVLFFAVQIIIGQGDFLVEADYVVRNLILYYGVYVVFLILFRRFSVAISVYTYGVILLALVDYYVTSFRGNAFTLMDVFNIGTAAEVTGNYSFTIPVKTGICLLAILIFLIYQALFQKLILGKKNGSRKEYLVRAVAFFGACVFIWGNWSRFSFERVDQWDTANDYKIKGFAYMLACESQYLQIAKPEGYSIEKVREIADFAEHAEQSESSTQQITPKNLIIIMNESLADFEAFENLKASEEILPNIHNLQENTKKGYLYVPAFGGGTADSEYEVLTGNTKEFLPNGGIAYQVYCHENEYGLANTLKNENYSSVAVHPFKAKGWNRTNVYSWMNFDSFMNLSNWKGKVEKIRSYASDETTFKKLEKIYTHKETENQFIFCVTMQNHGGYESTEKYTPEISLSYENDYPDAELYLSLAKESDTAFADMLEYFKEVEEPTMIVMFGDHWPNLDWGFFSELFGKDYAALDLTESQYTHRTPYVIWTNYPSESIQEDMSANYFGSYILEQAGLELTTYNKFLLQLKEKLPVIGSGAVCDDSGNWYAMDALPDEYNELINQYQILQYNNVADRKHRLDSIFAFGN